MRTKIQNSPQPQVRNLNCQTEVESRTQDSRPRTQKTSEAKNLLPEDRPSRGGGRNLRVFSEKKTRSNKLQKKNSPKKVFL